MKNRFFAASVLFIFLALPALGQYSAFDPSRTSLNARTLGMGRSFAGLADDTSAIYTNPAGLGAVNGVMLSSMGGNYMEDYKYMSVSGLYPTEYGTFGIAFGGYWIAGAFATTTLEGSDPNDPIFIRDPSQSEINSYNTSTILSYGAYLDRFIKGVDHMDKVSLGMNLKFFMASLSGGGIGNGAASGMEMDIGLLYKPLDDVGLGVTVQNVLPASMGGKLVYGNGHEEAYPASLKAGISYKPVPGLVLLADYDQYLSNTNIPGTAHAGMEINLPQMQFLSLRAGIDQSVQGNGLGTAVEIVSNLTYGVGLNMREFSIDYAYRQNQGVDWIDNHFISISYAAAPPAKEPPKPEIEVKMTVSSPEDKLITFNNKLGLSGEVLDPDISVVKADGRVIGLPASKRFSSELDAREGKNKFIIAGHVREDAAEPLYAVAVRVLRLKEFTDVPREHWAARQISLTGMSGIITGYPDGTFKPNGNITRAEMAALLMRSSSQAPAARGAGFKDVRSGHWAQRFIDQAAVAGVVTGYPDGTFRPSGNITRAEGLAMISRFAKVEQEHYAYMIFPDIRPAHWAAPLIAGAYREGLLEFIKGQPFLPNRPLTRAEAVEMLYRTRFMNDLLEKDLLNWDSY